MRREKLRVQQREAALLERGDKMDKRDLAGIRLAAEHAFAEKGRAQMNAI
jgi:hypothetical protein